jgi:type VI secretion system protein ImpA
MATAPTIDIDSLLAPISAATPAGSNLRADSSPTSIYYKLKDARSGARAAERRADSEGALPGMLPEWQVILTLAPKALTETSKDLEVVAWFIEGLVRAYGFAGLRDGLKLAQGLVEQYWDSFYSLEDEDGMATRLAPLAGLNGHGNEGTLIQPLRKVAVTVSRGDGALAIYHYDQARALAAANESGGVFYIELLADLDGAIEVLGLLGQGLGERAGRDAPSTSDIARVLTTIRDTVATFSADLVASARAAAEQGAPGAAQGANGAGAAGAAGGSLRGREDALRTLLQVAEYFRRNEPQSPISTSLDEIVRRAKMPFAELLAELLPDTSAWRSALISAGIKPPPG